MKTQNLCHAWLPRDPNFWRTKQLSHGTLHPKLVGSWALLGGLQKPPFAESRNRLKSCSPVIPLDVNIYIYTYICTHYISMIPKKEKHISTVIQWIRKEIWYLICFLYFVYFHLIRYELICISICISVSVRPYIWMQTHISMHINIVISWSVKWKVVGCGKWWWVMASDANSDMYDTHVVCKPQNLFKTLLESIPRLLEFFSTMPSWHSPRCREVHGQRVVGRFHWQLGLLLRGTPQEEVFMVAFRFLMSSMQKQRTATPGPQGQARTHTTGNVGNALAKFFLTKQQGSVSAAHHPWSTPEMWDELQIQWYEIPSNSFSVPNIEIDGQHVNVMAARFLEYATHPYCPIFYTLSKKWWGCDPERNSWSSHFILNPVNSRKSPGSHPMSRPRNWEALHPIGEIHQKLLHYSHAEIRNIWSPRIPHPPHLSPR